MLWFPAVTERWSGSHPLRQSVSWCVGRTEGVHRWALFTCKCCQINPNGSVCVQFLYGFIAQASALGSCCLGWNCSENYPCVLCIAGPALSISQKTKASGYITGQDKQDLHPRLEAFSAGALVINNFLLATKLISEKKKKVFCFPPSSVKWDFVPSPHELFRDEWRRVRWQHHSCKKGGGGCCSFVSVLWVGS